jgi:hypothetical protein
MQIIVLFRGFEKTLIFRRIIKGRGRMNRLPTVDFCGLNPTRLVIGANPFVGGSHQNTQRNREMLAYYTRERIIETWFRAERAGINTMVTNNESPGILETIARYYAEGGALKWIAQVNIREKKDMISAIDEVLTIGCKALFLHGSFIDKAYAAGEEASLRAWCAYARKQDVPVGVAGHNPQAHLWVNELDIVDFHAVCFFHCESIHEGAGDKFRLADMAPAVEVIRTIEKPCIGYKIMGSGRIEARMAFEYAFENIKPNDVINVGMYRGDKDDIVEENAQIVNHILSPAMVEER